MLLEAMHNRFATIFGKDRHRACLVPFCRSSFLALDHITKLLFDEAEYIARVLENKLYLKEKTSRRAEASARWQEKRSTLATMERDALNQAQLLLSAPRVAPVLPAPSALVLPHALVLPPLAPPALLLPAPQPPAQALHALLLPSGVGLQAASPEDEQSSRSLIFLLTLCSECTLCDAAANKLCTNHHCVVCCGLSAVPCRLSAHKRTQNAVKDLLQTNRIVQLLEASRSSKNPVW
jgi:hypothetical protein